ncbi:chemotaxis protein CheD [Tautonia plasticadhaerens]|uniref:Probable chemoreceptor glutamine deamidase CheD n=1 Tax=Tautonia plasticadhaerens TaxID=2527974 RepID=A0A518H7K6_9BACT|nr:chemotaxis protein CheD [Tautonia plasticadhaerens]QDV36847.1 Chemoreceptor glutamine deamidase CheD [Tautonia plasticadhaerens]
MSGRAAEGQSPTIIPVMIGRWAVAAAPATIRTLLGSCVAIIVLDRAARVGGLAHVVLPEARGRADSPGKYADTAVPAMLSDLDRLRGRAGRSGLVASVVGGAAMFKSAPGSDVGRLNVEAADRILGGMGIPVIGRDAGGSSGRNVVVDLATGVVRIRVPGGPTYDL